MENQIPGSRQSIRESSTKRRLTLTLSISDEMAEEMKTMPEINWSEVCRQAIRTYISKRRTQEGELKGCQ